MSERNVIRLFKPIYYFEKLIGYGLVVGLAGTGDKSQFTMQSLQNLLRNSYIKIPASSISSKNIYSQEFREISSQTTFNTKSSFLSKDSRVLHCYFWCTFLS